MKDKKELNENEVEKVSGGNGVEQKKLTDLERKKRLEKLKDAIKSMPTPVITTYAAPRPIRVMDKLEIIKKEQNKDKEEPEKGKLSE